MIHIGNNVSVAADVHFYEHDLVRRMWICDFDYKGPDYLIVGGNPAKIIGNTRDHYNKRISNK